MYLLSSRGEEFFLLGNSKFTNLFFVRYLKWNALYFMHITKNWIMQQPILNQLYSYCMVRWSKCVVFYINRNVVEN